MTTSVATTSALTNALKQIVDRHRSIMTTLDSMGTLKSGKALKMLSEMQQIGAGWGRRSKLVTLAINGPAFSLYKEKWDELPNKITQAYPDGPYQLIREVYNYGEQMADMYIAVWQAWFSGKYISSVPKIVDPSKLSVPKMYSAVTYITHNEMTPERWKVMSAAPEMSIEDVRAQLHSRNGTGRRGKVSVVKGGSAVSRSQFVKSTGDIRIFVDGQIEQVGFLNVSSTNPAVISEVNRIIKACSLKAVR